MKKMIRLLLVEDDAVDRLAIRRALTEHPDFDFVIREAETGSAGLQLLREEMPDGVLLDYHLPDFDGIEFLRELATKEGSIVLSVIMLTGADNTAVAVEAMRCGARDYLVKDTARQYLTLLPAVIARMRREQDLLIDKRRTEQALAESDEFNRQIIENAQEGIVVYDLKHRYRLWNRYMKKLSGLPAYELLGKHPYDVLPILREHGIDELIGRALDGETVVTPDIPHEMPTTGKITWSKATFSPLYNAAGETTGALAMVHDITDRKNAEADLHYYHRRLEELVAKRTDQLEKQTVMLASANTNLVRELEARRAAESALARQKELAEVTLASIGDAVITTDAAGNVSSLNPAAEKLVGWNRSDAVGLRAEDVFRLIHETTRMVIDAPARECALDHNVPLPEGSVLVRPDSSEVAVTGLASLICSREGNALGSVIVFHDGTQERQERRMTRQLAHRATHDALTELINRAEFERRLERALTQTRNGQSEHALLYIDLDNFKAVNDGSGHAAGDELLQQLSNRLQGCMRARDTLARLGGDEFGVLLEYCPLDQAALRSEQLLAATRDFHFTWQDKSYRIGASIGLVLLNLATESVDAALRAADNACYVAKAQGRNRLRIHCSDDLAGDETQTHADWVTLLTQAMEKNNFRLYCQNTRPLGLQTNARRYQEVLLRLANEDGSVVLPGAFLPAAERHQLMCSIDRWVLRRVIAHCAAVDTQGDGPLYAVNLSSASMDDADLPPFIQSLLDEYQVSGGNLCLEITEAVALANIDRVVNRMRAIKALGCRFALDNFGTGASSFTDLHRLPLDYLKLDASFIGDAAQDQVRRAMIEAINKVAHAMAIQTVAEGTESESSLAALKELGLDHAQGYVIMRPQPLEAVADAWTTLH